jgi:hypothetical protein
MHNRFKSIPSHIRSDLPSKKMDILKESKIKENEAMSPKPRRQFTNEQKAEAVRIVAQIEILPATTSAFSHLYYWAPFILLGNS